MTGDALPKRILQIHNRYRERGGEDVVVDTHRSLLQNAGFEVRRFEVQNPDGGLAATRQLAVAAWNPMSASRVRSMVREWRPAIAHIHNTWFSATPSVISALRSEGIPSVMTLHNYRLVCINAQLLRDGRPCQLCVGTSPWAGVRFRCYRNSYPTSAIAAASVSLNRALGTWAKGVKRFLVFTSFQRAIMVEAGLDPHRVGIVSNFVDDPGSRSNEAGSSETFLYVGRLSPEKGVVELVDAWARAGLPGFRLEIVGDGPLRSEIEERRVQGIAVRGWVSPGEVRALMLRSRALVFPSVWYEGQPLVLLEALAAGLPVVAPRLGALGDTLGQAAFWVDQGWDMALSEISEIDDRRLAALSRSARDRYEERFTPDAALRQLTDVYQAALTERQ